MSNRAIYILLLLFIVLAIGASYPLWKGYLALTPAPVSEIEISLSSFNESVVEKVSIKKNTEEKILLKDSGVWKINNFNASPAAVKEFFKDLSNVSLKELVSKNPDNHKSLEVTEGDGYILSFTTDGAVTTFIVGKNGMIHNTFYARKKDVDNVYLMSGGLRDKLQRKVSDWRDKTLANIAKEEIEKIEIESKIGKLTITKNQDGKWQTSKNGDKELSPLDDSAANRLFASLNPLEGHDFLDEKERAEFEKSDNKTIFRVFNRNGDKITEMVFVDRGDTWWGSIAGAESSYKIAKYRASDILLTHDTVFKDKKTESKT